MNKKSVFFSTDALIALIIIFITIVVIYPVIKYSSYETSIQSDVINVLSTLKTGDIDNAYVKQLISERKINDLNKSVLEQIGEFYIVNTSLAKNLGDSVFSDLDIKENIGIWYGNTLIFSRNSTSYESAKNVMVDRQIISGIKEGSNISGFSARAYLSGNSQDKYFYFGGYLGEGNISVNMNYSGNLTDAIMEIAVNNDFDIYINNIFSGHYENSSSEFYPKKYDISAYIGNFHEGNNLIKIVSDNLHIAGGYIKITYRDSGIYEGVTKYNFPGIEGIINLYDGFYIPGNLTNLDIFLHFNSNLTTFLTIGNTTVFRNSTSGTDKDFTIDNNYLSSIIDYGSLNYKTIPLRFGIENISYTLGGEGKDVDVFSVNDISGSMGYCATYYTRCTYYCESPHKQSQHNSGNRRICSVSTPSECTGNVCGTSCTNPHSYSTSNICNKTKLDLAKDSTNSFINLLLNNSANRVGLVGYSTSALDSNYHSLSDDNVSLITDVNSWNANGGTCVCCGINKAVNKLITESTADKFRYIVIMSDGQPTYYCNSFNDLDGSGTRGDATGGSSEARDMDWAINASYNAWKNYGIKVYAIGFGSDVDVDTMQKIASCGNGTYNYANIANVVDIYQQVAQQIIQASYNEQTIVFSGNLSSILYPDSYIKFNYIKAPNPYGLVMTFEKQFYDDYYGNFFMPINSTILETKIVSYSGPRWTDNVQINNHSAYNLSYYGSDYTKLGDPYSINIPNYFVNNSNIIKATTGLYPQNSTIGSSSNKIIYTVVRNVTSYGTSIYPIAEGCAWNLEFEDSSSSIINIPANYSGTNACYYNSTEEKIENENDAMEVASMNLLKLLDSDSNGKLDVKLTQNNIEISFLKITGIPYDWKTEVQVRTWN